MQARTYIMTDESRLRTPFRLAIAAVSLFVTLLIGQLVRQQFGLSRSGMTGLAVSQITTMMIVCTVLWIVIRYVDRRQPSDYGLVPVTAQWVRECGVGTVVGGGLIIAIAVGGLGTGAVQIAGLLTTQSESQFVTTSANGATISIVGELVAAVIFAIGVAVSEEAIIRGYLLPNVESGVAFFTERYATLGAMAITSGLFAVLHLANPGATVLGTLNTFLAGMWFAAAYVFTRRLGLAVGLHLGWNLLLGAGVGLPVSGFLLPVTIIDLEVSGSTLLLGNTYGPEAGLFASVAIVAGIVVVGWYADTPRTRTFAGRRE
jgi:membrane protease YdiL (CAAX protease family)